MHSFTLSLDIDMLLAQLRVLGNIGLDANPEGGRTRIALTEQDKAGRDQLVKWMLELDMDVKVDRIGNIFGILPAAKGAGDHRPIMIGSHIDTVRNAGALDGCYGVLAGLGVVRAYRMANRLPERSIVVAAFTNEEGVRYQPDMMGSLVYAGGLPIEAALNSRGTDGSRLGDELARIGYAGNMEPGAIIPHAYLELHIEQGPILEAEELIVGAVEDLQGISWQRVTVRGTANHAGTTPTSMRHDAGYVAASTIAFLRDEIAARARGTTLATVGSLQLEPNLINVIPRIATFTVDLRDPDEDRLKEAETRLATYLKDLAEQEGVQIETEQLARFQPVKFDEDLVRMIEDAATSLDLPHRRMTSGAGHDAQMIARIAPAAMIFVPSRKGISHNPREHTDDAHLARGAQVLLDVVQRLIAR